MGSVCYSYSLFLLDIPDWKQWLIGELNDIGTWNREISSNHNQGDRSPSDVPNEEWNNGGGDIIVQCVNDKGKITLLTLESLAYIALAFFLFSKAALA